MLQNAALDKKSLFAFFTFTSLYFARKSKAGKRKKSQTERMAECQHGTQGKNKLKSLGSFRTNSTKEQTFEDIPDKMLEQIMIFSFFNMCNKIKIQTSISMLQRFTPALN